MSQPATDIERPGHDRVGSTMSSDPPWESPMTKLTFNDLVALEPRLAHLLTEARSHKPSRKFCANEAWYGCSGLKDQLVRLVGWARETAPDGATDVAKEETLKSSQAYDVAYDTVYQALPDCGPECVCGVIMQAMVG